MNEPEDDFDDELNDIGDLADDDFFEDDFNDDLDDFDDTSEED
jgi:hypothetical protein